MSAEKTNRPHVDTIAECAAQWLARSDRGLTAAEQDDYLQWLREDPRHVTAIARHEQTLKRLMQLKHWQPAQSSEPNPDLFAPVPVRRRLLTAAGLAAAAVFLTGIALWLHFSNQSTNESGPNTYLVINERKILPDHSIVELKNGSGVLVEYTSTERRVRLIGDEAHFTVAKNPARPFIVEAGGVLIRAVGTAFDVRLDPTSVRVLVTEGKVHLEHLSATDKPVPMPQAPEASAGQIATVSRVLVTQPPVVTRLKPEEIKEALAWEIPQFQFYETPLANAVAEFNRHNHCHLVLGESQLGSIPIGGTFRVDNVEGFTRLLEVTLDLRVEHRNDGTIVLTRAK